MISRNRCLLHCFYLFSLLFIFILLHSFSIGCLGYDDEIILPNNCKVPLSTHISEPFHRNYWSNESHPLPRPPYSFDTTFGGVGNPWDIATGDLNGDGFLDIAYFDSENHLRAIDGVSGNLLWVTETPVLQQNRMTRVSPVIVDYDKDGTYELFYSEAGGWLNIADGGTGEIRKRVSVGAVATVPKFVDIDGDNVLDIIVGLVSYEPNPVLTCLNGRTLSPIWSYYGTFHVARTPAIADIDDDGDLEIVLTGGEIHSGGIPIRYTYSPIKDIIIIDATSGRIDHKNQLPDLPWTPPIVCDLDNDRIYEIILPCGGKIIVLDCTTQVRYNYNVLWTSYVVAGNWDGDNDTEAFVRTTSGFSMLNDSTMRSLILPGQPLNSIKRFILMDYNSDGGMELLFNAVNSLGTTDMWVFDSHSSEPLLYYPGIGFLCIDDFDNDGVSELLVTRNGTMVLLDENDPTVSISIDGMVENAIVYPESKSYAIVTKVEFLSNEYSIESVCIIIGNETVHFTIECNGTNETWKLIDDLNISVELTDTRVQSLDNSNGRLFITYLTFPWNYSIVNDNWISAHIRFNGGITSKFEELFTFYLEKGVDIAGNPVLIDANGGVLFKGVWTASDSIFYLTGLKVIHEGSTDLLVSNHVFGVRIEADNETIFMCKRGELLSNLHVRLSISIEEGEVLVLKARLVLIDMIPGASSSAIHDFVIKVDAGPPVFKEPSPSPDSWINKSRIICSIILDDGEGSGLNLSAVEWRMVSESTSTQWDKAQIFERQGAKILASVPFTLDKDGLISFYWRAWDMVGNFGGSFNVSLGRDTEPPEIIISNSHEWYNETLIQLEITVQDGLSGLNPVGVKNKITSISVNPIDWKSVDISPDGLGNISIQIDSSGKYRCWWWVIDNAGNPRTVSQPLLVDIINPVIEPRIPWILNSTNGDVYFNVHLYDLGGSGFEDSILEYSLDTIDNRWIPLMSPPTGNECDVQISPVIESDVEIWLKVNDKAGNQGVSSTSYRLNLNEPPVATISHPRSGKEFTSDDEILLDGRESHDPDNQILSYRWMVDGREQGVYEDHVSIKLSTGEHLIFLVVSDGYHTNQSDTISINIIEGPFVKGSTIIKTAIIIGAILVIVAVWNFFQNKNKV